MYAQKQSYIRLRIGCVFSATTLATLPSSMFPSRSVPTARFHNRTKVFFPFLSSSSASITPLLSSSQSFLSKCSSSSGAVARASPWPIVSVRRQKGVTSAYPPEEDVQACLSKPLNMHFPQFSFFLNVISRHLPHHFQTNVLFSITQFLHHRMCQQAQLSRCFRSVLRPCFVNSFPSPFFARLPDLLWCCKSSMEG